MKCPVCKTREAGYKQFLGVIPCESCRKSTKLSKQVEFTSQDIKDQRKQYASDIIQPFREGHVSKEYLDKYGTKHIDVSPNEVKNAQNVWVEEKYYNE